MIIKKVKLKWEMFAINMNVGYLELKKLLCYVELKVMDVFEKVYFKDL